MSGRNGAGSVHVIAVTHDSAHVVDAFADGLDRLRDESSRRLSISVVDNASNDETRARARSRGLDLVESEENRGWSAGNNVGLAACPDDAAYVLLLNPDVVLPALALDRLVAAAEGDDVGAAVPWLTRGGANRPGAAADYDLSDAYLGVFGRRRVKERRLLDRIRGRGVARLDGAYPEGGCLLLRRAALDRVGPFDERFFLYFDDVDLGRRLDAAGWSTVIVGDALAEEMEEKGSRVIMDPPVEHQGAEQVARYRHFLASELLYYEKWWSTKTARRVARYRLHVDLPIQNRRWRRRHGITDVAEKTQGVLKEFLAR